jgi:hypothetical protein
MNIVFNYFIHPLAERILLLYLKIYVQLVQQIYFFIISFIRLMWMDSILIICNLFIIILQLVRQIYYFIISFIHLTNGF